MKNILTADIECSVVNASANDCKYIIAKHIPISVGYICQSNSKHYFGLDCIKRFASDLLEVETENNFKFNKPVIFKKEDELYQETNNNFHIRSQTCIYKIRDHCHETGKYRGSSRRMCNLRYKQKNFFTVIFRHGSG